NSGLSTLVWLPNWRMRCSHQARWSISSSAACSIAWRTRGRRAVNACPWYKACAQTSPVWLMRMSPATSRASLSLSSASFFNTAGVGRLGWPLKGSRVLSAASACISRRSAGEYSRWLDMAPPGALTDSVSARSALSARWPVHLALAEYMHMDVVDRLAAQVVAVHYDAKAFLASSFFGQALRREQDMTGERLVVFFAQVVQGRDVLLRNHQKMHGRLWRDVVEGDDLIVLVYLLSGNVTRHDLAAQTITGDALGVDGRQWNRPLFG